MRWVRLAASDDVRVSSVIAATWGDRDLVVWRADEGMPVVMDARCPHEWSHLAAEGVVDGCELVCTAHFWRFDRAGHGTKVNIKGRRDDKADAVVYECREVGGVIEARISRA